MHKLFLTFDSPELEIEYQRSQTQNVKKPVFLFMIAGLLTMNLITVAYNFFFAHVKVWYLNLVFAIFCIAYILIFAFRKNMQYFQLAITTTNIWIGILQLNINQGTQTGSEYYAFGNTFMQYQAVLYLISDFPYAVVQFTGNLLLRLVITIMLSQGADYLLIVNGIIAVVLLSITTYVKDRNERKNFVQSLKDCHMNQISSFLITEPYFKVILNPNNVLFEVTQEKLIENFPGYNSEYCCGCNIRDMLRNYMHEQQTLEQYLLKKGSLLLPGVLTITHHKRKFKIRVSEAEITELSYIIILDEITAQFDSLKHINHETNKLHNTLLFHNKLFLQKFFNWGVLSVILLQRRVLKQVDIRRMFQKLLIIFQSQLIQVLDFEIKGQQNDNQVITYTHQLKIFMIQLLNVLLQNQKKNKIMIFIEFQSQLNNLQMTIKIQNCQRFIQLFNDNYFIRETKQLLTDEIRSLNHEIIIYFKNYPLGSFCENSRMKSYD